MLAATPPGPGGHQPTAAAIVDDYRQTLDRFHTFRRGWRAQFCNTPSLLLTV